MFISNSYWPASWMDNVPSKRSSHHPKPDGSLLWKGKKHVFQASIPSNSWIDIPWKINMFEPKVMEVWFRWQGTKDWHHTSVRVVGFCWCMEPIRKHHWLTLKLGCKTTSYTCLPVYHEKVEETYIMLCIKCAYIMPFSPIDWCILYGKRPICSISLLVFRGVAKVSELDTV